MVDFGVIFKQVPGILLAGCDRKVGRTTTPCTRLLCKEQITWQPNVATRTRWEHKPTLWNTPRRNGTVFFRSLEEYPQRRAPALATDPGEGAPFPTSAS